MAWSTTQKWSSITISGTGNKTASHTAGGGNCSALGAFKSRLIYCEFIATTLPATYLGVGIGQNNLNGNITWTTLLGTDTYGCCYRSTGAVVINNATVSTIMTFTTGDRIGMAVDTVSQKIWFRKNNGNWNNDVIANQNPVGAVGGISLATMTQGSTGGPGTSLTAYGAASGTGSWSLDINTPSANWTDVAPTGYVSMDVIPSAAMIPHLDKFKNGIFTPTAYNGVCMPPHLNHHGLGRNRELAQKGNLFGPASSAGVSGTTKVEGVAAARRVRLYDAKSGEFLEEVMSDGSGVWSLPGYSKAEVIVIALDDDNTHNAARYVGVVPGP